MAMKWIRAQRTVHGNGEAEILYESDGTPVKVESRKKAIPHANGRSGCWMRTTYFVIRPDGTEEEHWSLARAKEIAEKR